MKGLPVLAVLGGLALVGLGTVMAVTNPHQDGYDDYAVERLSTYLKEEACSQVPQLPQVEDFLQRQCKSLVDTARPQIKQILSEKTERQNFLLFSIYRTDLNISPSLPAYHVETVGVFQKFYIYQLEEQGVGE
ncbi:MAG: DUF4359 domain-containing protein [Symploca sp. SIO1B1]|nr:DUF4359 domain-containing protein [Symploca sp. SIO1C2]NER50352.1 DUF4359 domain-containing protein [Symploca sp. SIO1A3]NER94440.1 DUF4359 domain-containing protein [Symploca sp. SIO1B1]